MLWSVCTLVFNLLRFFSFLLRSARSTLPSNPRTDKQDSLGHRVGHTSSLSRAIPWYLKRISVEQQVKTTNNRAKQVADMEDWRKQCEDSRQ